MSWFGRNTQTLCEELRATSANTIAARQKAVEGLLPAVREAVVATIRTFAMQNQSMETTVNLDALFSMDHESGLIQYFRRANGSIHPLNPTNNELDSYGNKIVEDLKAQGLDAEYDINRVITVSWKTIPEPVKTEFVGTSSD